MNLSRNRGCSKWSFPHCHTRESRCRNYRSFRCRRLRFAWTSDYTIHPFTCAHFRAWYSDAMKKQKKLARRKDNVLEIVNFIKDRMATKGDLEELRKEMQKDIHAATDPIKKSVEALNGKMSGTNARLDLEAMQRDRLQLPRRVSDLEVKKFGASKHPKEVPL